MKLVKKDSEFCSSPFLVTPIDKILLETLKFKDFDKDGYEVPTPLEYLHYEAQNVELNREIQFHIAPASLWFYDQEESEQGLVLDHCMILTRWAFAGEARKQIFEVSQKRPILNKLLNIKPKWGIDFSLDWISHDICIEVIHIEQDFYNIDDATSAKQNLESIIENTDWKQGAKDLIRDKNKWKDLGSDDQSDYKARHFGINRAFDNKKVFSS